MTMEASHQPMLAREGGGSGTAARPRGRAEEVSLLKRDADPDAVVDEILSLLGRERYRSAQSLACEALALFPDHGRIRGVWGLFNNHDRAKISPLGTQPSTDEEFEWLKHPPEWAAGKWVALVGSEAVASADTLAELEGVVDSMDLPKLPLAVRIDGL